jgi:hypothetical protein
MAVPAWLSAIFAGTGRPLTSTGDAGRELHGMTIATQLARVVMSL